MWLTCWIPPFFSFRWEAVQLQLGWLRQAVRPLRRALPSPANAHRREEVCVSRVRPAIHAQRPPHQTRAAPHDHEENSLLAGWCQELEQNGCRQNASLKTRPRHNKHAGTCRLEIDSEHCHPTHSQDTTGIRGVAKHMRLLLFYSWEREKKNMHWTLFFLSTVNLYMYVPLKDSFVYFDISDHLYAPLPKPLYEVCLTHFTFSPILKPFVSIVIYVNVLLYDCIYLSYLGKNIDMNDKCIYEY